MTVLVIGSTGQLGTALLDRLVGHGLPVLGATHEDVEIRNRASVTQLLARTSPSWVISTAAMHKVVDCETDREAARAINVDGTRNVVEAASELDARVVFISTDYVFSGRDATTGEARTSTPYDEDDPTDPVNYYGVTKAAAERIVLDAGENLVVRVAGLFGRSASRGKGGNFVSKILDLARERDRLSVIDDQVFSPTRADDAADVVASLIRRPDSHGVYHGSNTGQASWFDLARVVVDAAGLRSAVEPVRAAEFFHDGVARPAYSAFGHRRLLEAGVSLPPHWEDAARAHVASVLAVAAP